MRKTILSLVVIGFSLVTLTTLWGCAGILPDPAGPGNAQEAFPVRNQDPRLGLIINEGTDHLNLFIYDEAGRLIEQVYLAGANRFLEINGQHWPRYWVRSMAVGSYRVEFYPFYYQTNFVTPLVGLLFGQRIPVRYRVDLPKQTASIWVDRNPTDYYYAGRHWAWILRLNTGNIPETAHGLPGIKFGIQGNF